MFKIDVYKLDKKQEQEVKERIDEMFKRFYKIRKIRRKKKIKEWLGRHLN